MAGNSVFSPGGSEHYSAGLSPCPDEDLRRRILEPAVVDRLEGEIGPVMQTREVILNLSRGVSSAGLLILFFLGVPVQLALLLVAALLPMQGLAERNE